MPSPLILELVLSPRRLISMARRQLLSLFYSLQPFLPRMAQQRGSTSALREQFREGVWPRGQLMPRLLSWSWFCGNGIKVAARSAV